MKFARLYLTAVLLYAAITLVQRAYGTTYSPLQSIAQILLVVSGVLVFIAARQAKQ